MQEHLQKLGSKAYDKVTKFEGIITCVSFDLYGCIQYVLMPPTKDGKIQDPHWFDSERLVIFDESKIMPVPSFFEEKGPAEKPNKF